MNIEYKRFIESKRVLDIPTGFEPTNINSMLFPFQHDIVRWAIKRGRAAIFADCGLGKTPMQLEWADKVSKYTDGPVLILAPLAVSHQTAREGEKFGIKTTVCKDQFDVRPGINITNYEKLNHFSPREFSGIVLDESSILKSYTGKFRNEIISSFSKTPYRLACTATPAPNDYMELGNHAEFLGAMSRTEMLSMFFIHDGGDTAKWRLKGHGESAYWEWLCSWAVYIRKPSNLGYKDDGFSLPALLTNFHNLSSDSPTEGYLFAMPALTLEDQRKVKRGSINKRVEECAKHVNETPGPWVVWAELNNEADALEKSITGSVQIAGSDTNQFKEQTLFDFSSEKFRVLISKPSICGFGLNWQHCSNMAFVSLSHSYESFYQAVRRCWRFGQLNPVNVHIFTMDTEQPIIENIERKDKEAKRMAENMIEHMADLEQENIRGLKRDKSTYKRHTETGNGWELNLGDCVEVSQEIESDSIDYTIFSPPFASLYTYSNSERDMGNCKGTNEFMVHFSFLAKELYRITKPGRNLSFHVMNLPISKEREGFIGIRDFRGEMIRLFVETGFIYHSEVCIWKDPVTAMQRTKAIGLLYKQLKKDSCISRQGIPDYLVTMRKPGENPNPVTKCPDDFPVSLWQRYASPVWMDINPSDTLQSMRDNDDERHICPLQLEVIERAIVLWSNRADLILSPFAGIGSEGYEAIRLDRRFVGIELKESYFNQAVKNLISAEQEAKKQLLFA
jgi:DNA modification methylase